MPNQKITISTILEEFKGKFLNKDNFSSEGQFKKEFQGKLPSAFQDFIIRSIKQYSEAVRVENPKINSEFEFGFNSCNAYRKELDKEFWENKS